MTTLTQEKQESATSGTALRGDDRKRYQFAGNLAIGVITILFGLYTLFTISPSSLNPGAMMWWGFLILIAGLWLGEKVLPKKWAFLPVALGAAMIIFGLSVSGFAAWTARNYDVWVEQCLGDQICPEPTEHIRTLRGGTLSIKTGESIIVNIAGEITVPIPAHHCVDVSPRGMFQVGWNDDLTEAYVAPLSGSPERGTITALPARDCG